MENETNVNKTKAKKKRVILAADTGSVLTYDKDGNLLNELAGHTHLWDAMKREYKKCARCGNFYLIDSFPKATSKNSKDGHGYLCAECQEKRLNNLSKPPKSIVVEGEEDEGVMETLNRMSKSNRLSKFSDLVLLDELRRRGYTGKLTLEVEL